MFNYVPEWDWSSLPQSYLESAYLSMDTGAVNLYFQQEDNTQIHSTIGRGQGWKETEVVLMLLKILLQRRRYQLCMCMSGVSGMYLIMYVYPHHKYNIM